MPLVVRYARRPLGGRSFSLAKSPFPINDVADAIAPGLQRTLVREMSGILSPQEMSRLVAAVRDADVAAIVTLIPAYDPANPGVWKDLEDSYQDTIRQVVERAGKKALATYGLNSAFALDNPYTQGWLTQRTGELITNISDDARATVRSLVEQAWTDGIPPKQLANLIKPTLGLNEQQAAAVQRRYESTRQALEDGGMGSARAASVASERVKDYADDLLDQRALNIARTETIAASTAGAQDAWNDAKDQGFLPDDSQREWVASPEGLGACRYCVALDGQRVPFDEDFETDCPSVDGSINRPPLHVRCRCTVRLILPGLNDAQSLDDIREENERENANG